MTTTALPGTTPRPPRGGPVRKSKRAKWRAIVLIAIHVAIVAHVLHWWITGSTITPIEPSEAMQTLELGKLNAGFVFFALAILATLVLGRWFCGWACHVVAYQDLAAWLLARVGLRPKPIRSRLLMWTPMLLALYMFVWPQFKIWFDERRDPLPWRASFMTENFWETFAGPWMATVTLLVCGFLVVYWLGAKGFCSYGCPYGGFFGFVDKYAPGRIRVTDDCEGCRHCTATCTSNVVVHEEVLRHGMVVDPGCMKCLDCVSVCPKGALYFGFGKPAVGLKNLAGKLEPWMRTALTFACVFGLAFAWIWWSDSVEQVLPVWFEVASAAVVAAMITLPHRREKPFDFTLGEEFVMAAIFLVTSQLAFRRLYNAVPNLLAIALGALTALCAVSVWRMIRNRDFSLQHHKLRESGKLTNAGFVFAIGAVAWLGFTGHSYAVQHEVRSVEARLREFHAARTAGQEAEHCRDLLRDARVHANRAASLGLFENPWVRFQIANMGLRLDHPKEWPSLIREIEAALQTEPTLYDAWVALADANATLGQVDAAVAALESRIEHFPQDRSAYLQLADGLASIGDKNGARVALRRMLARFPDDPDALSRLELMGEAPPK